MKKLFAAIALLLSANAEASPTHLSSSSNQKVSMHFEKTNPAPIDFKRFNIKDIPLNLKFGGPMKTAREDERSAAIKTSERKLINVLSIGFSF